MRCGKAPCQVEVYRGQKFCTYHEKIKTGLLQRADEVLSEIELDTMFDGRLHQDGRRLDHYVLDDEVDMERNRQ